MKFDRDSIQISDDRLAQLMERFTPLYRKSGTNDIHRIEIPDLRNTAFTWGPKLLDTVNVTPVRTITTSHSCAYYGFFKPSIAEVLAHVKDDGSDWGDAFFIEMEDVGTYGCGGGHYATTQFVRIV